jgi:putative membrane protein
MKAMIAAASLLLATIPAAPCLAETASPDATRQSEGLATQAFFDKVWNIDNFEIRAARLAESQVKDIHIRDYAQMIERDHKRTSEELTGMASRLSLTLPKSFDKEHERDMQLLTSAQGQRFTQIFRAQQIEGHRQAIALFESYAAKGDNAEARIWAKNTLPILRGHLAAAEDLREPSGTM